MERIIAEKSQETLKALKFVLEKTWDDLDMIPINKLYLGFSDRLRLCIEMNGTSISRFLGLGKELRDVIANKRTYCAWTEEEDKLLYQLICKFGHHWKYISKFMQNRSPVQCKSRWFFKIRFNETKLLEERFENLIENLN